MMKRLVVLTLVVVGAFFLFIGCGKSTGPAKVAESFSAQLAKGNFEEAKKFGTEQTVQILSLIGAMGASEEMKNENFKFILVEEKIDGDNAIVSYRESVDGEVHAMKLKKVDGVWKVHMTKDG